MAATPWRACDRRRARALARRAPPQRAASRSRRSAACRTAPCRRIGASTRASTAAPLPAAGAGAALRCRRRRSASALRAPSSSRSCAPSMARAVTVPEPLLLCEESRHHRPAVLPHALRRRRGGSGPHRLGRARRRAHGADRAPGVRAGAAPGDDAALAGARGARSAAAPIRRRRGSRNARGCWRPMASRIRWRNGGCAGSSATLRRRPRRCSAMAISALAIFSPSNGLHGAARLGVRRWGDAHEDLGWFCLGPWRFGAYAREAAGLPRATRSVAPMRPRRGAPSMRRGCAGGK